MAVEKYLHLYDRLYGLEYVILRPSVPYGPGQDPRRRQGAINVFLHKLLYGQPIEIWGDGEVVRDYFYISDLTRVLLNLLDAPSLETRVFNLGGGKGYTLNELILILQTVTGREANIEYLPGRRFDVPSLVLDTALVREYLAWTPQVTLEEGVECTWDWIQDTLGG